MVKVNILLSMGKNMKEIFMKIIIMERGYIYGLMI